ncbi:hypothetical protein PINS_up020079 [Pythium insidiosum]|nr:hypothetical protein PINS_up020079 [Pythium insidiosum]
MSPLLRCACASLIRKDQLRGRSAVSPSVLRVSIDRNGSQEATSVSFVSQSAVVSGSSDMSVDPAFQGAGKKVGLEAWRIEKMQPVRVANEEIGKLFSGDSYIFLKTSQEKSGFTWNIHFWLGKDTTADESGVAAYKTVELDDSLGGGPVQYRECQGHESVRCA